MPVQNSYSDFLKLLKLNTQLNIKNDITNTKPIRKTVQYSPYTHIKNIRRNTINVVELSTPLLSGGFRILLLNSTATVTTNDLQSYTPGGAISGTLYSSFKIVYISDSKILINNKAALYLSTDNGNTWQTLGQPPAGSTLITDVWFASNTYYALTPSRLYKSIDNGSTWSEIVYLNPAIAARGMFVRGTNFILVGSRILWTSTDGIQFTDRNSLVGNVQYSICNPIFNNGTYYLFGYDFDNNQNFRLITTDLVNFSRTNISETYIFLCVKQNSTTGIMVGWIGNSGINDSGIKWSNDNGVTWNNGTGSVSNKQANSTVRTITSYNVYPARLCFNGSVFVTIMADGTLHYSVDGKVWYLVSNPSFTPSLLGVLYNDETGQF